GARDVPHPGARSPLRRPGSCWTMPAMDTPEECSAGGRRALALVLVLAMGTLACAAPQRTSGAPGTVTMPCITQRVCTWDESLQRQSCRCAEPAYIPLGRE